MGKGKSVEKKVRGGAYDDVIYARLLFRQMEDKSEPCRGGSKKKGKTNSNRNEKKEESDDKKRVIQGGKNIIVVALRVGSSGGKTFHSALVETGVTPNISLFCTATVATF